MAKTLNDAAVVAKLQRLGLSFTGARQILAAQIVTNQKDRDLLAEMFGGGNSAGGDTVRTFNFEDAWPTDF